MNKKDFPTDVVKFCDEKFINAIESGKGQRVYGAGTSGISVGDEYTILGVTAIEDQLLPDSSKGITTEQWRNMSAEEREENGVKRSWLAFTTNNGNLAFSALMGEKGMFTKDYWSGERVKVSEDFDVDKLFRPSCRTGEAWIKAKFDGLIGKTVRCVGTKTYTPEGQAFDVNVRAWAVLN